METVQQLKQVEEQDLEDIRMKPEDIQKLKKNIKKEFPQSAFGRLKKVSGDDFKSQSKAITLEEK